MSSTAFKNYIAGVGTGSMRMFLHVLTGLFLTPFVLRHLDRQEFAIFNLTLDMIGWLALLDIGITAGLRIQAARLSGVPEHETVNRLASTAFLAQNIIVFLVLLFGGILAVAFPSFFAIRPDLQHDAMMVACIGVLGAAVSIGSQTFSALLVANQQMHIDNLLGILLIVIRTVLTVVLLKAGWGIYSLAVAFLAARVTTAILAVVRTYRLLPKLRIRYSLASWEVFQSIGSLGIWFSLGQLAGIAIGSMSSAVTAKVISMETVTILLLTGRFYELCSGLVFLISENARPMLGQMLGQNQKEETLRTYRRLFALSSGLAVVAAFGVWAGNEAFVTRWVGRVNYGGNLVDLALAFTIITSLWNMPNRVILSANLNVRGQTLVRILEGILNMGLAVWFGKKFGLVGIPLGGVIACLLTSMWLLPMFTAHMYGRSFWQFLWEDAARVLLQMALLFPAAYAIRMLALSISGYVGAAIGGILTGVIGLVIMWYVTLDKGLRERLALRTLYERAYAKTLRLAGVNINRQS